ncbi:MAG: LysR family transcriptional regulator [Planktotalea sp.]|uniref:LysR family transcriptional regulator n=1 Tax=Planktotalea sp. TaxID=2029877 RepID=UPI003C777019
MDNSFAHLDWSLIRAFLAVAETGSLSGAARSLSQSQPTLGRQIKVLEDQLGLRLFERQARGLSLSAKGEGLLEPARAMRDAFGQLGLRAAGQDERMHGTVRITASEVMAQRILPQVISRIRQEEPNIQIELVSSNQSENLLFREADIAVRMYRSTQLDVITKQIGVAAMGIYAARSYLSQCSVPTSLEDLLDHPIVGYDRDDRIIQGMRALGWPVTRDFFAVRCDDENTYWELVRAGCGIGFTQQSFANSDPMVQRILPEFELPTLPIWLAAPEAMRATPRIKRVWEMLEEGITPFFANANVPNLDPTPPSR